MLAITSRTSGLFARHSLRVAARLGHLTLNPAEANTVAILKGSSCGQTDLRLWFLEHQLSGPRVLMQMRILFLCTPSWFDKTLI